MKKQYLLLSLFFILIMFLVFPRSIFAVVPSPNAASMKIDVIKETGEGEEENSVQVNQIQTVPTATITGSVKAEVKPVLVETEETLDGAKEVDSQLEQIVTVIAPMEIKPALEAVVANNKNEMVKQVEVNGSNIKINYAQPVKLFGFIPIKTNLEFSANMQNKKVEVKTPWWLFLASSNTIQVKNQIQTEVNKEIVMPSVTTAQRAIQSVNVVKNILKSFLSLIK